MPPPPGINTGIKEIVVNVNNRIPFQIFSDNLSTNTYTALVMPDVFTDEDGMIVAYAWSFPEGVNLDGGISDRNDDFTQTTSNSANPMPGWDTPGLKTVELLLVISLYRRQQQLVLRTSTSEWKMAKWTPPTPSMGEIPLIQTAQLAILLT